VSRTMDLMKKPDYQGTDEAKDEATYASLGHGGELVVELTDNVLVAGEGPDLAILGPPSRWGASSRRHGKRFGIRRNPKNLPGH
jgi:hypothetical protein